jgi:hypothetical protein
MTISPDATATSVVSSFPGNVGQYGQAVTLTASVTPVAPGSATPVGLVQFYDNGAPLGIAQTLSAGGTASITTAALSLGDNVITAQYGGNNNFLPSNSSATSPLTVKAAAGIIVLDQTSSGSLSVSGNGKVDVENGSIIVDSSNNSAVIVNGNGDLAATEVSIDGGYMTSGDGDINGVVATGQPDVPDPLSGLPTPDPGTLTLQSSSPLSLSGQIVVTLNPGVYRGGVQISGDAKVTLNPGIYYMQGGGFSVSGNGAVTDLGKGVMIYNAAGSNSDSISLTGDGSVSLSPIASGPWQGMVLFQSRTSAAPLNITGNGQLTITGTIYAADATLNITGNGGNDDNGDPVDIVGSLLVVDDLIVNGNGSFSVIV